MPPYQGGGDMIDTVAIERQHVRAAAGQVRGRDAEHRRRGRARRRVRLDRVHRARARSRAHEDVARGRMRSSELARAGGRVGRRCAGGARGRRVVRRWTTCIRTTSGRFSTRTGSRFAAGIIVRSRSWRDSACRRRRGRRSRRTARATRWMRWWTGLRNGLAPCFHADSAHGMTDFVDVRRSRTMFPSWVCSASTGRTGARCVSCDFEDHVAAFADECHASGVPALGGRGARGRDARVRVAWRAVRLPNGGGAARAGDGRADAIRGARRSRVACWWVRVEVRSVSDPRIGRAPVGALSGADSRPLSSAAEQGDADGADGECEPAESAVRGRGGGAGRDARRARWRTCKFGGRGCSISQASASMMTELVKGRTPDEVQALGERFAAMIRGDADGGGGRGARSGAGAVRGVEVSDAGAVCADRVGGDGAGGQHGQLGETRPPSESSLFRLTRSGVAPYNFSARLGGSYRPRPTLPRECFCQ